MKLLPSFTPLLVLCLFLGHCVVPFNCEGTEAVNKNELTSKVNGAILATDKDNTDILLENTTPGKTVTTQSSNNGSSSGTQTTLPERTTIPLQTTTPSNSTSSTPNRITSTTSTSTVAPTTSTNSSTSPPPTSTTTTTIAPTTPTTAPLTTTTVAPNPEPCHRFDGPSFIGGIVLTLGLLAIGVVAYKFYKARNERNYQTL